MNDHIALEPDTRFINTHEAGRDISGSRARSLCPDGLSASAIIPVHGKARPVSREDHKFPECASERITERELQTAYMLLAWIVEEWNATPETAQSIAKVRFGINDLAKLTRSDYHALTELLVSLYIDDYGSSPGSVNMANAI